MAVHMKDKDGPYDAAEAYNARSSDGPPAIPPSSSYSTLNVGNRDSQILMRNGIGSPTTPNHHVDITEPINSHKSNKKKNNLISSPINGSTNANEKESRAREVTLSSSRTRSSRFSRAESWVPSRTASLFLITIITEAAIVIALVSTVFAKILVSMLWQQCGFSNAHHLRIPFSLYCRSIPDLMTECKILRQMPSISP